MGTDAGIIKLDDMKIAKHNFIYDLNTDLTGVNPII